MSDLQKAKQMLAANDATCVFCCGESLLVFTARGVKPLVELYDSRRDVSSYAAADKVVGKGAAFLYLLLGVRQLYAGVISRAALDTLTQSGVSVEYTTLVENIRNRRGDGICPFEQAVLTVHDAAEAYRVICEKMKQLGM